MNKVKKEFQARAIIQPGGWAIYSKEDSIEFIKECRKQSIKILGIDSFYLLNEGIKPNMENSIDFSLPDYGLKTKDIYSEAIAFLETRDKKLFFEIVCDD